MQAYFSVPSRDVLLDQPGLVKAFEYSSATRANQDAALVTPDGQPRPATMVDWIDVPHFYKRGPLIVLLVGCDAATRSALNDLLGPPFAGGRGCD